MSRDQNWSLLIRLFQINNLGENNYCSIEGAPLRHTLSWNPKGKIVQSMGSDHYFNFFFNSAEHPTEQPLAALLKTGHLKHHQASPYFILISISSRSCCFVSSFSCVCLQCSSSVKGSVVAPQTTCEESLSSWGSPQQPASGISAPSLRLADGIMEEQNYGNPPAALRSPT